MRISTPDSLRQSWRSCAVAGLVGLLIACATPAAAQEGWASAPLPTPSAAPGSDAALGTDAAGNLTAAWVEIMGPSSDFVLKFARHDKHTGRWTAPVTLWSALRAGYIGSLDLVVDDAGNTVLVWAATNRFIGNATAYAARYSITTGAWAAIDLPNNGWYTGFPLLAGNAAGDAVIVWAETTLSSMGGGPARSRGVLARRFSSSTGQWSAAERLTAALAVQPWPGDVAIDGARNVQVVWNGASTVQTARFDAIAGTWAAIADLSGPLTGLTESSPWPQVAMNDAGAAVVTWSLGDGVMATRLAAGGSTWTAPVAAATSLAGRTYPAIDARGSLTLAWLSGPSGPTSSLGLTVARYVAMTGTWSAPSVLAAPSLAAAGVSVAVDGPGNAFVAWSHDVSGTDRRVWATRYAISTETWEAPRSLSSTGRSSPSDSMAVDAAGNAFIAATDVEFPVNHANVLRWNAAPGAPVTTAIAPTSGTLAVGVTAPPTTDPPFAATNLEYSLDNGATWLGRVPAATSSPLTIGGLSDGVVYALRVRAVSTAGAGVPAHAIAVRSGTTTTPAPLRVVSVTGNAVTLAWSSPDGIVPTGYLLEGGVAPQQTLASVPTGGTATSLTVALPSGIFYARIIAVAGAVRLSTSNEARIVVGVPAAPAAPTALVGTANGSALALSWTNTLSGGAPSSLLLNVSGPVSGSIPLPVTETFSYAGVPPGTYTFSVTTVNVSGASAPSAPVAVTFPGVCAGPFNAPADFVATATGSAVFLTWNPPPGGPAVTGYLLQVSGAFNGSFAVPGRTLSTSVGPGSYTLRVSAITACGVGTPTAAQTLVVP